MKAGKVVETLKTAYIEKNNEWKDTFDYVNQRILADFSEEDVTRKQLAVIVHEFLAKVIDECDEEDWSVATSLKDLYDCRVCAKHIAQIYAKGIMDEVSEGVFGADRTSSDHEITGVVERTLNRKLRSVRKTNKEYEPDIIGINDINDMNSREERYVIVDVRTEAEYCKGHMDGAVNMPLAILMDDAGRLEVYKDKKIVFWCEGNYQSDMAARFAHETGYVDLACLRL